MATGVGPLNLAAGTGRHREADPRTRIPSPVRADKDSELRRAFMMRVASSRMRLLGKALGAIRTSVTWVSTRWNWMQRRSVSVRNLEGMRVRFSLGYGVLKNCAIPFVNYRSGVLRSAPA